MLTNLFSILVALLMLGVIIVVHELGHYAVGRLCGIGILEFSVGLGPKLFGWRRKGIDYSVRAIPLGGFCKFVGEDEDNTAPNAMNNMPVWKRILTVFAGAGMNFVLAYVAAAMMLCFFTIADVYPMIDTIVDGSPAAEAQLLPGDVIAAVNGEAVEYGGAGVTLLRGAIQENDAVTLTVRRDGATVDLTLTPAVVTDASTGTPAKQIGVVFASRTFTLGESISGAGQYMVDVTKLMLETLRDLFFKGKGVDQVAGPVGTISVVSEIVQSDMRMAVYLIFILSLNIGIMNLLPIPGLDGGRLIFLIVEGIRRKPVPPEKEGMVHAAGLLLLLGLAVVLTWHDIMTYII